LVAGEFAVQDRLLKLLLCIRFGLTLRCLFPLSLFVPPVLLLFLTLRLFPFLLRLSCHEPEEGFET
jgi:hypothetical protein